MATRRKPKKGKTGRRHHFGAEGPSGIQTLVWCSASAAPALVLGFLIVRSMRGGAPVRIPLSLIGLALALLVGSVAVFMIWWRTPRR